MRRAVVLAGLATAATMGMASAAQAEETGFSLCNRTRLTVDYAKGLNLVTKDMGKPPLVASDGWGALAPGECKVLWPGALKHRYYLIYAAARASNRVWEGSTPVCVENGTFQLAEPLCPADRNRRMFIEIDTGEFYSFTYDLN